MKTIDREVEDVAEPDQIASGAALTGQENTTQDLPQGDIIWYLYDRQDRIAERLNKKITRLEYRVKALEERGRT